MEFTEILNLIISLLTLGSIIFGVFFFFRNPQEKLEKRQAVNDERDKNKAERIDFGILKTQFDMMCKINSDTFAKLETQIKDAFAIANNHTNETDSKVTGLVVEVGNLRNDVTRLGTIIEERIPKKC
jgi:hypothetical protein